MSILRSKDRASLCSFTFADGRRCRTPRFSGHPRLCSALGHVFTGVAQGSIKRKTAATLAFLGQTMLNSIQAAQHEYINAFSTNSWRETIRSSFNSVSEEDPDPEEEPDSEEEPDPQPSPEPIVTTFSK